MQGMSLAKFAIFFKLNSVWSSFFVLGGDIVTAFAFLASQRDSNSHYGHLLTFTKKLPQLIEALN